MPLIKPGIYAKNDDLANEAETTYYLRFHIKSALISLHMISSYDKKDDVIYESKAQYYHFYTDHLLYSLGQIAERFRLSSKKNPTAKEIEYNERRKINRNNYQFTDKEFPILSDKSFRNTVEHIDEHNVDIIDNHIGVGGFNYIDDSTSDELIDMLLSNRHNHIYTLNLKTMEIYITRQENKLTLDLTLLTSELNHLLDNVNSFASFIENNR